MPTTLKLKNSVTAAATPTTLVQGEAAVNVTDKKVWVGNAASSPVQILGAGATLDGMAIGGTTAAAGKFTTLEATGVATFSAGTVSLPAITTTGDTNTGIFFPAADTIAFTEGGVESMRIDSNGNLGLGITPQTWYLNSSVYGAFQFGAGALFYGRTTSSSVNLELTTNSYLDSSAAYRYLFTGEASKYNQASGAHIWSSAASGTAGNSFSYSERMRIDSSGNVGIGTSSPLAKLYVVGSAAANSIMTETSAFFGQSNGLYIGSDGTDTLLGVGNSGTKLSLLSRSAGVFSKALTVNSDQTITFNGYGAGTLSTNGSGLISASDGRYKTKTRLIENGIQKIIQLQPTYYKWNENSPFASEYEELGFIAQEVAVVIPEASPENDNDKKYRNYHDRAILATLVKAIQEQQALIENLTTRLNALEGN